MFGGFALFLDRHFRIDRLGHVYFVASPLLGLLIGVMGIGIMRVLYRAPRSLGTSPKPPRRSFTPSRSASLGSVLSIHSSSSLMSCPHCRWRLACSVLLNCQSGL